MLLSVPEATHELAISHGFQLTQLGKPAACCICDQRVSTFEWSYHLHQGGNMWDLWCSRCIEFKLADHIATGRALR